MNLLERWALRRVAKAAGVDPGSFIGIATAGSRMNRKRQSTAALLAAWTTSPWFRGVVERVSFAAAVVPWELYSVKVSPQSREYKQAKAENRKPPTYVKHSPLQHGESFEVRERVMKELAADDRLEEITDHKLFDIMASPNPAMTGVDLRLITFASITVVGEIGWSIVRGDLGQPEEIWPVPSHWITRTPGADYAYYDVQVNGQTRQFSQEEFILFKNPTLANPYGRGSGLGYALADELETDEYIAKFQNTWFTNRGKPDIIFTVKPSSSGGSVDPDELKRAKEEFENQYRDVNRGGRSFWTRGDIDVKEISQKLVDLDLTEQRTWIKDLVREVIGCPPEIMGDIKQSNRATITEALAILAILSTVPQLERMRAQLQMKLIPMFDDRLVLSYCSPVPEDREFKLKAIQAAPWTAEQGELRTLQGLPDRGDADRIQWIPNNVTPIAAPARPGTPSASEARGLLPQRLWENRVKTIIAGGPRTGKSTLAQRFPVAKRNTTDDTIGMGWSQSSHEVSLWFDREGPWVIEGVATVRALRKWLQRNADEKTREAAPCERVIVLTQPRTELSEGQVSMTKGIITVWNEIAPELERRGVDVIFDPSEEQIQAMIASMGPAKADQT